MIIAISLSLCVWVVVVVVVKEGEMPLKGVKTGQ